MMWSAGSKWQCEHYTQLVAARYLPPMCWEPFGTWSAQPLLQIETFRPTSSTASGFCRRDVASTRLRVQNYAHGKHEGETSLITTNRELKARPAEPATCRNRKDPSPPCLVCCAVPARSSRRRTRASSPSAHPTGSLGTQSFPSTLRLRTTENLRRTTSETAHTSLALSRCTSRAQACGTRVRPSGNSPPLAALPRQKRIRPPPLLLFWHSADGKQQSSRWSHRMQQ